ncbi:MAG: type II toxin-antitoxin system prevent-host-death family antitoxin [Acidobacteriota bacterium]|nr:type II toxin-antitoxin system prevent-host-death family antitoxin [Acidobacteriota bacterium]MDH3522869.1 type II toxin-antitoxin system prevent-host-death family antitoxin [Acidobacteriota bacterium]
MKTISVSELKTHLSEQLRAIKRGSRVLITERGKPVAELGPPASAPDRRLADLQATGVVAIGKHELAADFWVRSRPQDARGLVREALLQERREGR